MGIAKTQAVGEHEEQPCVTHRGSRVFVYHKQLVVLLFFILYYFIIFCDYHQYLFLCLLCLFIFMIIIFIY